MKVKKYTLGNMGENCYVLFNENNKQAVIIDLGCNAQEVYNEIISLGYTPVAMLLTHGHFDHAGGGYDIQKLGVPVYISEKDAYMLVSDDNMAFYFGEKFKKFTPDGYIKEGDFSIGGLNFKVISTPGHTAGSVCFLIDDYMFAGDTLFYLGYGRPDLPSGSFCAMMGTLKRKLFKLEKDYVVFAGHGEDTTLFYEKEHNPCLEIDHD